MPLPPEANALLRGFLIGVGRVGARAAVHATKSVLGDGTRLVKEAERRLKKAQERLDKMAAPDDDSNEDEG
jgi:hypothetical protein